MTNRQIFIRGVRVGMPIALGYFAVAFSLGIIARKASLIPFQGFVSSAFTRASAGEYGVYALIAVGTSCAEVAMMCLIANLRYLLMSSALTQKLSDSTSMLTRVFLGCCMTDEVFGVSIAYPGRLAPAYTFGAASISTLCWALGTACGIVAGNVLPTNIVSALSVALYGMFIAVFVPPSKQNKNVCMAVCVSFLLSWLCSIAPMISEISSGLRTILLTIVISAVAALLKPVGNGEEGGE